LDTPKEGEIPFKNEEQANANSWTSI